MEYITLFDVGQTGYRQWWVTAVPLAFVALSIGNRHERWPFNRVPRFSLYFTVFLTLFVCVGTLSDYLRLSMALRSHRCELVEGEVTSFQRKPSVGPEISESFMVGKVRFEYSSAVVTAGFNQTQFNGGPIRELMRVRISHLDGEIARLESVSTK